MRATEIIAKKRDGKELSQEEIAFLVRGYNTGEIPDYQVAAWTMAVTLRGMTDRETLNLTLAMTDSGEKLDLKDVAPFVVDKHSTGGVGDKVTLVVAPLVAACGLPIGKMSGRGLGFSGGTVDKMESIPGYRTDLSVAEFKAQLRDVGIVLTGQSANLAPVDKKLYALRDVTATVECLPLIVSSIMCKKIAAGADAIVLDVKTGSGAFMKTVSEAEELAQAMVRIGRLMGRKMTAVISGMNQPLGWAVGNALEVREAIDTLHRAGPPDLREHCLAIAAELLLLGDKAPDLGSAIEAAQDALASSAAWQKFVTLVKAQGGDVGYVENPNRLPTARLIEPVPAPRDGYLQTVDAAEVGMAMVALGGGREKKDDPIDHAVGIIVHHKVGAWVEAGSALFTVHANDSEKLAAAREQVLAAHTFSDHPVDPLPLFYRRIREESP